MSGPDDRKVFLSYASEDRAMAARICDALQQAGLAVWFDADGGLEHGDEWDAKIRRQIRECILFIPIVSAHTQARLEGYFRLEWELAAQRALSIASGVPFILPVVIDGIREADALVPDRFRAVQWIRLRDGQVPAGLCQHFRKLWLQRLGQLAPKPASGPPPAARSLLPDAPAQRSISAGPARGRRSLRNFAAVALLLVVGLIGASFLVRHFDRPAPTAPAIRSVAVMPFHNLSPHAADAHLADGIHDDVITGLTKIRDLAVIARQSVLGFRNSSGTDFTHAARQLGVAHFVTGSVRRDSALLRVNAALVEAATGKNMWAESFEVEFARAPALQGRVVSAIAHALNVSVSPGEHAQINRQPTRDPKAYNLYLRAKALGSSSTFDSRQREKLDAAIVDLQQAVIADPEFADAYAELAGLHGAMYWFARLDPTPARLAQMKAAADAALRLGPDLPAARKAIGAYLYRGELKFGAALAEFQSALRSQPNDADLLDWIGLTQRRLGLWSESLISLRRALELNPYNRDTAIAIVEVLYHQRRFAEARRAVADISLRFSDDNGYLADLDARFALELDRDYSAYLAKLQEIQARLSPPRGDAGTPGKSVGLPRPESAGATPESDAAASEDRSTGGLVEAFVSPKALHLANAAYLRGDATAARIQAESALAQLQRLSPTFRQQGYAMIDTARALALSGQSDAAFSEAQRALAHFESLDQFDACTARNNFGEICIILGRHDEAIEMLRRIYSGPSSRGPEQTRRHPFWAILKSDPRFDAILDSARPL